ncbi:hypothetical protein [Endozoicomonas sp. SCSIO W0465]|uniref:hypothetical protein n=1 Tax=Endozoicomonas sp. SCSIO W0465 TaxID=2918516 RepID=UPI0020750E93|nr:hypothetical protein [Endozoicomonas sp. SCSIO W0465]USE35743.1 hypothetical protein MJO57_27365 [Endozoicomonas sp. SCSIO W0465]
MITTTPLSSVNLTAPAIFNETAMANTASTATPGHSPGTRQHSPLPQPTAASVNETVMADTTSQQPVMTPLNNTAMAEASTPSSSLNLATPTPFNNTIMINATTPEQSIATPLPTINATINATAPLAAAAMTTTAPVTETVVTLPAASMTFTGMPPTSTLPTTPIPLVETLSNWVVVGASLGTAFTIVAGIGACALYQYCQRQNKIPIATEPEIPLEALNQQAK